MELKTTDVTGKEVGTVTMNVEAFGGKVKHRLLHSAAVMYHNNLRQGSAATKTRAMIAGTTQKLFRQKGTGRARVGTRKSGIRKGGGVIHGPQPRNFVYHMPKKQRRAALRNALLGKAMDGELHLVQQLSFGGDTPSTKNMIALLEGHGLKGTRKKPVTVLVATEGSNDLVWKSGRNIPGVTVMPASQLNARAVLLHSHLIIEAPAFERLNNKPGGSTHVRKPKGTRKGQDEAARKVYGPGRKRAAKKAKQAAGSQA